MVTIKELKEKQKQVKRFSTEWFQLNARIEDALTEEAKAGARKERLPAVSDKQIAIADYVLSDQYDDD